MEDSEGVDQGHRPAPTAKGSLEIRVELAAPRRDRLPRFLLVNVTLDPSSALVHESDEAQMVPQGHLLHREPRPPAAIVLVPERTDNFLLVLGQQLRVGARQAAQEIHAERGSPKAAPIQHAASQIAILVSPKEGVVDLEIRVHGRDVVRVARLVKIGHAPEVREHLQQRGLALLQDALFQQFRPRDGWHHLAHELEGGV
mmetsp:Transcript_13264/g.39537  ORF Transcript_13264/g.39537 Transcript_13264/m.39537 type:complete len:200 (+) Transcript_13264:33-632(+)